MIGFINCYLPRSSGNAGSKYFTIRRTPLEILQLFKQSVIDISSICNGGIFIFADFSSLKLHDREISAYLADINLSSLSRVHANHSFQLTNRDQYLQVLNHICKIPANDNLIFYSGNHDHLLANTSSIENLSLLTQSLIDNTESIIFPTHYPEFAALGQFRQSYLGFKRTESKNIYKAKSMFSFMILSSSLFRRVLKKINALPLCPESTGEA